MIRVTAKPPANSRAAMRIDDREIVTSPTLKPKKTARKEPVTSVDSMPHGASTSRTRDDDERRVARRRCARTPICSRERRRRPVLAWSAVAIRLWPRREPPMNSSASAIAQDQQREDDGDPDRLIDQEGGQRDIAAQHAADDEGDEEPAEAAQGAADVRRPARRRARGRPRPGSPGRRSGAAARRRRGRLPGRRPPG